MTTPFENQVNILADLWSNYKHEEGFKDFVQYNDLGLPLAYMIDNNIVKVNNIGEGLVGESWDLLLASLEMEDTGFENLDDLLDKAEGV